jgi:hypothetical protein
VLEMTATSLFDVGPTAGDPQAAHPQSG